MILILARLLKELCDLVYPPYPKCPACGQEYQPLEINLCTDCITRINFIEEDYCSKCGKMVGVSTELCFDCREYERSFTTARAVGVYEKGLKDYIKLFKYQKQRQLAEPLAELMAIYVERFYQLSEIDYITYIPVHQSRLRERGFNQAYLLAKRIADSLHLGIAKLLKRKRATVKQSKLGNLARRKNLRGEFKLLNQAKIINSKLLVVDDIYTTGTTVNEASNILLSAGAAQVKIITLATGKDLDLNKEIE